MLSIPLSHVAKVVKVGQSLENRNLWLEALEQIHCVDFYDASLYSTKNINPQDENFHNDHVIMKNFGKIGAIR